MYEHKNLKLNLFERYAVISVVAIGYSLNIVIGLTWYSFSLLLLKTSKTLNLGGSLISVMHMSFVY